MREELCPSKVTATHKMTDTQKKLWKTSEALAKSAMKMKETAMTSTKKFWNKVEADLDDFDSKLRVNQEDMTIEVFEEEECEDCDENK